MNATCTRECPEDERVTPLTREEVGAIIRDMLDRRKYRLKALAVKYGVSVTTLRRIEARWRER